MQIPSPFSSILPQSCVIWCKNMDRRCVASGVASFQYLTVVECGDYIASVCEPGYVCAHVNCRGLPGFSSQIASRQTGSEALHIIAPILLLLLPFPSFLPPIASMLSRLSLTHSLARPALIFVNFRAPPFPSCFLVVELQGPVLQTDQKVIHEF